MLNPDERKAVHAQLDGLQPRIKALKQRLNELNDQKEKAFQQRDPVGKEISGLIAQVKQLKSERDRFTDEVKKLKVQRSALSDQIKVKIATAKKLNEEKKKVAVKVERQENPGFLRTQIERLDHIIETQAPSFEKEKAMMKEIKELKKRLDAAKQASAAWGASHELSKEIDGLQSQADAVHRQIQQKAKESQDKHELLMQASRKIDGLRGAGNTFTKDIGEKKSELAKLSSELTGLQKQAMELRARLGEEQKEQEASQHQQRAKKFSEKLAEVKAKMKSGGKLTTEDILVMQGEN